MSHSRIYLVQATGNGGALKPRLIEAGSQAAARNHATKDMLTVRVATAKEVATAISGGTRLEIASEAPPEQQPLPGVEGTADGTTGGEGLGSSPDLPDATLAGSGAGSGGTGESEASDQAGETPRRNRRR
jgi:hypothetical protein